MTVQCTNCLHNKVCRNAHLMKEITETVDAAIDHIEVTVEDKACRVKDLPWVDLNKLAIYCRHYVMSQSYRIAEAMSQSCQNAIRNTF